MLQKGHSMKTIFKSNNRGKVTLYLLFAVSVLSFVALMFCSSLLPPGIAYIGLLLTLAGTVFLGGLIIDMRNGPPW